MRPRAQGQDQASSGYCKGVRDLREALPTQVSGWNVFKVKVVTSTSAPSAWRASCGVPDFAIFVEKK